MIKNKESIYRHRKAPEIHIKYSKSGSNVVSTKKKEYEYYICDYCGEEIRIEESKINRTGGILKFKDMKLALHNRCLKSVLKEYE